MGLPTVAELVVARVQDRDLVAPVRRDPRRGATAKMQVDCEGASSKPLKVEHRTVTALNRLARLRALAMPKRKITDDAEPTAPL